MKVSLIVAMDAERGIGKNNDLMWHLPNDMKFFKETTQNQVVVMGRKNYDSIPEKFRPLPNRLNVVLTRNSDFHAPDCIVFTSLDACLDYFKDENEKTIFIIGGGEIYNLALKSNRVEEMYITEINQVYDADTFFPEFDSANWKAEVISNQEIDEKHSASFTIRRFQRG
jgi:dihydrofolate reductase